MQDHSNGAQRVGRRVGIFNLSENLRFPNDHRVQTCGHTKEVADGIFADMPIEVLLEEGAGDLLLFCKKRFNLLIRCTKVICAGNDLNPITRGQYGAFLDGLSINQAAQDRFQQPVAKSQPLTHFDRCAAVV